MLLAGWVGVCVCVLRADVMRTRMDAPFTFLDSTVAVRSAAEPQPTALVLVGKYLSLRHTSLMV